MSKLDTFLQILKEGEANGLDLYRKATNGIANSAMGVYRECMPDCKKHLGLIKAFQAKQREAYAVCDAKCRLKSVKNAIAAYKAASGKCKGDARCKRMVVMDVSRLNDYADRLELALQNAIKNAKK